MRELGMLRVKNLVRKTARKAGFEIQRVLPPEDLDLYRRAFPTDSIEKKRFYNIGAGGFRHPFWTNVDNESDWYAPVQDNRTLLRWDLLTLSPLPVEDGTAEIVYTSHAIEHVTDAANRNLFKEAHRALRAGGVFRLTTPDINLTHRAYKSNDRAFFYWTENYTQPAAWESVALTKAWNEASIQQLFLYEFASAASTLHARGVPNPIDDDELDRIFRDNAYEAALDICVARSSLEVQKQFTGNHINWWNADKAFRMLREAGFEKMYLSGYGQSASPALRNTMLFDSTHPKISLYVEAVK